MEPKKIKTNMSGKVMTEENVKDLHDAIWELLREHPEHEKYIWSVIPEDKDKEQVINASLGRLQEYFEFYLTHPDLSHHIGSLPGLRYDSDYKDLRPEPRYTVVEQKRRQALDFMHGATDFQDPASLLDRGKEIFEAIDNLPRSGRPLNFLGDAKAAYSNLGSYLKGSSNNGMLFLDGGENGSNMLDFLATVAAYQKKRVATIRAWETFVNLANNSYANKGLSEMAFQIFNRAKNVDVLCLYGLDNLPLTRNFIESSFIPFLGARNQLGKITYAYMTKKSLDDFLENFPTETMRQNISEDLLGLMKEFKLTPDGNFFKKK